MANLAQIQSIAQGQFFVKDSLGNLTELKVGDTVSLNDTIVAASSNTDLSKIEILFDTNELITLSQGEQLLDATLLASTFGNEELAFDKQEVDETLNAWNNAQDGDATDMETAAGDVTEQATNAGDERAADGGALRSKFNSRDGDATDIVSDLREASWTGGIERTIEDSENMLLEDPLPVVYTIEDSENMLLEDPLPVVYTIIEGIDVVNEGDSANYVVKLQDAAGNPVIATQDTIIYVRYTNKTTQDGDTQYNNENIIEVVIKAGTSQTEFTIKTNDDYLADNGEIYNVAITGNNSTEFDMRTGDVAGNKTNVDTTILDNSNPLNPRGEDGGYGSEDTVYVKISQPSETLEGGKLSHTVTLVDKDGNPVTIPAGEKIIVTLTYTSTDGVTDGDFSTIVKEVELVSNGTTFENTTIVDNTYEGSENYKVTITDVKQTNGTYENVAIHQTENSTTGKITDNPVQIVLVATDSTGTIPLKVDGTVDLEANKNSTPEGGKLYYVAVAVDTNGKPLDKQTGKVDVSIKYGTTSDTTDKDATAGVDYDNTTTITTKVGEVFEVATNDDYYAEGDEKFNVTISNPKDTGYDTGVSVKSGADTVTSTIKDNPANKDTSNPETPTEPTDSNNQTPKYGEEDTVYVVISGNDTKYEGGILEHTIKLVDKDGNLVTIPDGEEITVTIVYTEGTIGATKGTDYTATETVTFTSTTGNTITIKNPTKDDYIADNNESYTATIGKITQKDGTFENIESGYSQSYKTSNPSQPDGKSVTGTILDDTDSTPNNPDDGGTKETNHEQVILKIVACDASGNPLFEADGKTYKTTSNVSEGDIGYYKVFAFAPNTTEFTSDTKLPDALQGGTVTVSTQDIGAKGIIVAQDKYDGTQDYESQTSVTVTVGTTIFEVQTLDDYKAETEANETFKVVIDTNSYKHPENDVSKAIYENVTIDNSGVTTTIVDNTSAKNQTIGTSGEDVNSNTYGQEDTVWAVIEADKASVIEGNKVTYTVKLVDKYGNAVTVSSETNVTIKFAGGTNPADLADLLKIFGSDGTTEITGFDSTEQKLTIKIPADGSQTQFTIQTKDDFKAEGNENFDLSISDIASSEFENLVFDKTKAGEENKVTTEIKDGVTLGTPKNAYVDEDNFYINDFNNTDSFSEYTTKNISNLDNKTGHIKGDLGIIAPTGDNGYTLSFDNTIKVYKGNENGTETNIYGDGTALKSGGNEIKYKLVGTDKIVAYTGTEANYDKNKVFEITLEKDNNGKYTGDYKYTQYKNIDHPVAGDATNSINDDNITFEFGFKISDQGSTSSVQTFKVTVNDSTPIAGEQNLVVYEDSSLQFIISDEGFKENTIDISNDGGNKYKTLTTSSKNGANSIDILENGQKIGTLKNLGSGKLQFIPEPDYSKYSDDNLPNFKYKVSDTDGDYAEGKVNIKVKPVADAPTIFVKNIETTEDNNNTQEGTNKVLLELKVPSLSKDSDATFQISPNGYTAKQNNNVAKNNPILDGTGDYNGTSTGDSPERNGEITLTFTNSSAVTGAKIFNGVTEVATINSVNQIVKVVIVKTSGGTDIDTDYHHNGTLPAKGGNVLYLTKSEYESLKIQHAEDNDTDIAIKISVTSYEVDYSGKPLTGNLATSSTTTANMTVVIKPVTDDISLKWNVASAGKISDAGKTYTFNDIDEGNPTIDLKALLTKTSGTETFNGSKADLDGSEKRTYIISDIPAGTVIILDGNSYTVQDGKTSIEIPFTSNTKADPTFTMKFPENYSGIVEGKITLSVIDKGNGTEHTNNDGTEKIGADGQGEWGEVKTAEVNFKVNVNPVADDATVKVGQPVGYEDAGRTSLDEYGKYDKNIQDKDGTIKHPENGIKLPIEVTSTDTDGSEKFELKIKNIPNGGALFIKDPITGKDVLVSFDNDGNPTLEVWNADGTKSAYTDGNIIANKGDVTITPPTSNSVDISGNTNDNQPVIKFIPPHNTHGDFKLGVEAKTVDTAIIDGQEEDTQEVATTKDIVVVVKDVADSVVGNKYETEDLSADTNYKKPDERKDSIFNKVVDETDAETNGISLDSIFEDSTKLSSYDKESEDLTIILKSLPKGVELEGNVTLINGQYIFKASDIPNIKIVTPLNYSGELNFKIDYITTEKGETTNPSKTFDSKTSPEDEDKVSIFVKPTVDAGFKSNTTKEEDIKAEKVDGEANSYYKLDLGISHQNVDTDETLVSVKLDKPADGEFKLFIKNSDGSFSEITDYTKTYTDELKNIYVQAPENKHGKFDITVNYTVKDSHYGTTESNYVATKTDKITHTLNITPVTDKPTITVETGKTHVNVNAGENTEIKIPVKVSSEDTDGSENITKIVISGVPKGVTIDTGSAELDGKITVSEHNGIYTITGHNLNSSNFKDIVFKVDGNANFEYRDITITAYTKDAQGSIEEQTSTKITLDKTHNGNGGGTGTGPKLDIIVDEVKKDFNATEDTQFNFLDVFKVTVADNSNDGRTELNFKIDVGSNATLKGLDAYKNTDGSYTIKGNRADIESVLANLKVVPNKDFNSNQDADGISIKVETNGKESTIKVPVTPVTDSLNVEITANDNTTIDENGEFNFDIKLTNNSDKEFTIINDFYVVIDEKFEAGENAKGELYLGNTKLELVDGKYKLPADYKLGDSLNLTYKSGEDRNGTVEIKVVALNKETGATNELSSAGSTTITVKPVVSSVIEVQKVQDGIEDQEMASAKLNVVKADPSEKFESVLIKEVASGVAVYYNGGNSLAMNVGDGSWIVPVNSDGTLPQIFFKGSEHLAGNIGFKATINVKDGESKVTTTLKGSVYIEEVADGVTIDPTKTGIDKNAFEWTTLNLNANMKDLDGSEKMYLELKGLGAFAQFKLKDGGIVESEYDSVNKVWTIKDIAYDKINDIQFTNDKDTTVDIKAWTTDGIDSTREKPATGFMEVDFAKNAVENGKFTLGKEVNIDFSKIVNGDIQGVNKIDLSAEGENKLLNLTLDDVLSIGKKDGSGNINLDILGGTDDKVSFKDNDGWELKTENIGKVEGDKTFDVYTNSGNSTVQVKVEQPISDGITN